MTVPRDFRFWVTGPSLEAVADGAERLARWGSDAGIGPAALGDLLLVYDELATNVAKYSAGAREVVVRARHLPPRAVLLVLDDDGEPYDVFARPDPDTSLPLEERPAGGLGIYLVKRLARRVSFRRVRGRNRVVVELPAGERA